MQRNKIFLLIALYLSPIFVIASDTFAAAPIQVVHLYSPEGIEVPVHQFLFPLVTPYIQTITSTYNKKVGDPQKEVHKVFIAEIFRDPMKQRQSHFEYVTQGKGLLSFLKLYDRYNDQFVAQFLHIILPIYSSAPYKKSLLGKLNATLDKVLKAPFDPLDTHIISRYLQNSLKIQNSKTFYSVYETISLIAEDAPLFYDLDPGFLQTVKDAIRDKISTSYPKLPPEKVDEAAKENFVILLTSEIFSLIQKDLKKEGQKLFSNPVVGKDLTTWFKNAPAHSQHGLTGVPEDQYAFLGKYLKSGNNFRIAVDLGMKTNKDVVGEDIWNQRNSENKLSVLKDAILSHREFTYKDVRFTVVPEHLLFSSLEEAVHIELILSSVKSPSPAGAIPQPQKPVEEVLPSNTSQEPYYGENEIDSNMEKNFELPNSDSRVPGNARDLNLRKYRRILGKSANGKDKNFENSNQLSRPSTNRTANQTEYRNQEEEAPTVNEGNSNSGSSDPDDDDLDFEMMDSLQQVGNN